MPRHASTHRPSWHYRYRRPLVIAAVVIVSLLILRFYLDQIIQWYVNRTLDESPEYAGQVGDIDLAIMRGAYQIDDIEIEKTTGDVPVPFFSAPTIEFSLLWKALFDGAVVGEIELFEPVVNIVDSEDETQDQTGEEGQWLTIVDELFPLRIDRITIHQGRLHFRNFQSMPPVDVWLSQIEGNVQNLTNSTDLAETMVATVDFTALAMDSSDLSIDMAFDPTLENPTFNVDARLLSLPLSDIESLINAYAPFDIEAGSVDVVSELAASEGRLEGYIKPIIYDLDVFEWREDVEEDDDNPLRAGWEALVDFVGEVLQNQPQEQVATNVPIEGDISNPETSLFIVIGGILSNAFIEAFQANFENSISWGFGDDEIEPEVEPEQAGAAEEDADAGAAEEEPASSEEGEVEEEDEGVE